MQPRVYKMRACEKGPMSREWRWTRTRTRTRTCTRACPRSPPGDRGLDALALQVTLPHDDPQADHKGAQPNAATQKGKAPGRAEGVAVAAQGDGSDGAQTLLAVHVRELEDQQGERGEPGDGQHEVDEEVAEEDLQGWEEQERRQNGDDRDDH